MQRSWVRRRHKRWWGLVASYLIEQAHEQKLLTVDEYKACVGDQTNQQTIIERYNTAVEDLGVDGTPRIFINGDPFTPRGGWTEIEAEIERRVSRL